MAVVQINPIIKVAKLPRIKCMRQKKATLIMIKTNNNEINIPFLESFSKLLSSSCSIVTVPVKRISKFFFESF